MHHRNLLLSVDIDPKEALKIVRSLCSSDETVVYGVLTGLKWLKLHTKRLGSDLSTDALARIVVKACNRHGMSSFNSRDTDDSNLQSSVDSKLVLDVYREHPQPYGSDYNDDRRTCLYITGRLFMKRSKWIEAIRLLREAETLIGPDRAENVLNVPTLQAIQSSLSSALLAHGDITPAASKARAVLNFFRSVDAQHGPSEWSCLGEAAQTYCKACLRLQRMDEVSDTLATIRDLESTSNGVLRSSIAGLELELSRKGAGPSSHRSVIRRKPASARGRVFTCTSQSLMIPPPDAEASAVQVDEDEERAKSLPAMPRAGLVKQFVQSPRHVAASEWTTCRSRTSGREYYYNTRTGASTWNDPTV